MDTNLSDKHQSNRAAWNEAAIAYEKMVAGDIAFLKTGGKNLQAPELRILADLSDWCGRAIHLQCAGGRDTLSLWNQGAKEVVGVDISERMIDCARQKSTALDAPATWYRSDILDTPSDLDGTADLVYTGRGALCWMMDIDAWARVVKRLLKPGGRVYIFEGHPIGEIWDPDATELKLGPNPETDSYFSTTVCEWRGWPESFITLPIPDEEQSPQLTRFWPPSIVMTALLRVGLRVELVEEYPDEYCDFTPKVPKEVISRIPHTYSLMMRNPLD